MINGADIYIRFLNGDKEAFVELIREYKSGLLLFIHLSEEAADETFLKLYVDKPKYKSEYSFKTWLYTIGRNTALNYLKKNRFHSDSPIEDYFYISDNIDIEAEYLRSEQKMIVNNAMKALKKEYAQVLYLKYFEDLRSEDIAQIMDKSKRQISDLLYRAKQALKAELETRDNNG